MSENTFEASEGSGGKLVGTLKTNQNTINNTSYLLKPLISDLILDLCILGVVVSNLTSFPALLGSIFSFDLSTIQSKDQFWKR